MLMKAGQVSALHFFYNKVLFNLFKFVLQLSLFSGAQMEVDYTEKLNFSDDEENQGAKEKRDSW